uniref:NADH dehydrogenase subunit 4L n=1 Tax=Batracomorphus allionii TaxID=1962538 RepID=UPI00257E002B|nr:NADH dehydrogenase subunit 4L [Batracomorphus allionii]WHE42569.1 NADH dehydrogenase subunit 4L [Batracomorphus allionii]
MSIFFFYIFLMSIISLFLVHKHILLCLMMMEFMMISLLFLSYYFLSLSFFSMDIYIIFMVMLVCEGVLGLSCLIYFIRFYGNNFLNSMFMW